MVTYANRGKVLEKKVEITNQQNLHQNKALVQKIPTPVNQVSKMDRYGQFKAHYETKSTVDYIGVHEGYAVAFDAKETKVETRFDLSNVKDHQYTFLSSWHANGGISFLIVEFKKLEELYYLPYKLLDKYWQNALKGGRKSIPYAEFKDEWLIKGSGTIHYIDKMREIEGI